MQKKTSALTSKVVYPRALLVRMTEDEKVRVENNARKNGYSEGEVVRKLIRKHL